MGKDYYQVLGVTRNVDDKELKSGEQLCCACSVTSYFDPSRPVRIPTILGTKISLQLPAHVQRIESWL